MASTTMVSPGATQYLLAESTSNPGPANVPNCQNSSTMGRASVSFASLPAEQFDETHLCAYLLAALKGDLKSRATKQFLGGLIKTDRATIRSTIDSTIATESQRKSPCVLLNAIVEFDSTGDIIFENLSQSAYELWKVLKGTNIPDATRSPAFGRVVQICSPSPAIILQLLVCLGTHFDMDLLLSTFLGRTSLGYRPQPGINLEKRKIWSFSIKYYYLTPDQEDAYTGQVSGPFHESQSALRICHGSSSVTLGFANNQRIEKESENQSAPSDAAPWRLLILSCQNRPQMNFSNLHNGVEAYLWCIYNELTTARRSLRNVSEQISAITVSSDDFLFNSKLRESLLFEDRFYTNSRSYFWALQSLRIVNDCITSLITAWEMYKKISILNMLQESEGVINPRSSSSQSENLKAPPGRMNVARKHLAEIDQQIEKLAEMVKTNNSKQEEIRSLRDGLFNASAVLEARTTVTQGQNIRILTIISMTFLPASFATSVFGMASILPPSTGLQTFAIVISIVCGATYLLIVVLECTGRRKDEKRRRVSVSDHVEQMGWCGFGRFIGRMTKNKKQNSGDVEKAVY